ncbi:hypothetical protein N7499_003131 [Penicillium canescens]|uniref:Uncharacterized protein n=1 Tax=Penicillium canescens TaxID=5083 RepID=A0AAD6IAI0_PENCN|nr:hypothetical protein N7522_000482 [Penicillium canescens]KAJ6039061.1 hypothetical protein N7460_007093 [Penicillium canescens]KAJ6059918.1 hypothetical protein N7444_003557 [Penicillium canescens]KAJ6093800.1 hypothetical protein N7499_003131 [Penicillium canescens]
MSRLKALSSLSVYPTGEDWQYVHLVKDAYEYPVPRSINAGVLYCQIREAERSLGEESEVVEALRVTLYKSSGNKNIMDNMITLDGCVWTRKTFDLVMLGIPALAPFFNPKRIKTSHATKCEVEYENWLVNYLVAFWAGLMTGDTLDERLQMANQIDAETVKQLEGLAPAV